MGLKDKVKRLEKQARGDRDWLDLRDGTRYYFEPMKVHMDLFMERMEGMRSMHVPDLSEGAPETESEPEPEQEPGFYPRTAELRAAFLKATPESLRRFEEHYGPAEPECAVIHNDGSISVRKILIDGSMKASELEGEEALQYREKVRRQAGQ